MAIQYIHTSSCTGHKFTHQLLFMVNITGGSLETWVKRLTLRKLIILVAWVKGPENNSQAKHCCFSAVNLVIFKNLFQPKQLQVFSE